MRKFNPEYVSYEELYKAYLDCRKRKRSTYNAIEFEMDENYNLFKLYEALNGLIYKIGRSIAFCVDKPVKREVFAADFRDRIVHHLVINRLENMFEEEFINDSYSCRKGKGTDYGIKRCAEFIRDATEDYTKEAHIIKCDLKSFFMTIDKQRLYDKLIKHIEEHYEPMDNNDIPFLKWVLGLIIFNEPQYNCIRKQHISHWNDLPKEKSLFSCEKGKGIPIGNLTSQIFANFYLSEFDHYVTEELKVPYYGRYVDDFFLIVDDISKATSLIEKCREKLASMGVTLHPKKLYIQEAKKGVKFIGAVIKPDRTYISNRTKGNMYEKIEEFYDLYCSYAEQGLEPTKDVIQHVVGSMNSYLGFMKHYKTFRIRRKMLTSEKMMPWYNYCYNDLKLNKLTIFKEYRKIVSKHKKCWAKEDYDNSREKFFNETYIWEKPLSQSVPKEELDKIKKNLENKTKKPEE